jgi:hypothetical protein
MIVVIVVIWVICGIVAVMIGQPKGFSTGESLALGLILGVFGVAIVALLPPRPPAGLQAAKCPRCNAVQNVRFDQESFECWQCKYIAHARPRDKGWVRNPDGSFSPRGEGFPPERQK